MAYDPDVPPSLIAQGVMGSEGLRFFAWMWIDPIATVLAPGYIVNAEALGLRVGDTVKYKDTNRGEFDEYTLLVSEIDAYGAGTLAFPEVPEEAIPEATTPDPVNDQVVMFQGGRMTRSGVNGNLYGFAALDLVARQIIATDASGTLTQHGLSDYIVGLLAAIDAPAARTILGALSSALVSAPGFQMIEAASALAQHDLITSQSADLASAATLNLTTATGDLVQVTGTTKTTAVTLAQGDERWTYAVGNWPIAAALVNNGGVDYTCSPGDLILWRGFGGGVVRGWIIPVDAAGGVVNPLINLYLDSGRMAGNAAIGTTVGAFSSPAYFSTTNSAAIASYAKFIYNNTDYGGGAGTLDANVRALIDQIKDPSARRYVVEFWVGKVTMGSGTGSPIIVGSDTAYFAFFSSNALRPAVCTFHAYFRALDDTVLFAINAATQRVTKNGIVQSSNFAVTVADGWVSITVQDKAAPRTFLGYQPSYLVAYMKASGNRLLFACPALVPGLLNIDDNIGMIPGQNSWAA